MKNKLILALSGNDIFSGGGLHADLATYTVHGLHGFVAVTCLTAMTDKGFEVLPTDEQVFAQQLSSLKDVPFSAIKLGLLPTVAIADQALDFIKKQAGIPAVLDPVLVCKETHDVEVSALRDELIKFFPYTTIITPNLPEAEILTQSDIKSLDDLKAAAVTLHELGAQNVVIKGGNRFNQDQALDLFYDGKDFVLLESPVLPNNNTGAGCTFASSIASQLLAIVLGNFFKIPTPTGFLTLLDAGIYFTAFYFGRKEGALVGGLSGLLIDLVAGYPQWMVFSLICHGLQGYFAGFTGKQRYIGLLLAGLAMVGGYALFGSILSGPGAAIAAIWGNVMQNIFGLVVGYALYRAFPLVLKRAVQPE